LLIRLRQGRFGSRLLLKIASVFALVGVAPGVLIYGVSYQFVSRSIETWFDVKVEGALDAGIQLGRVTLDSLSSDFAGKVRAAALDLFDPSGSVSILSVQQLQEQWDATDVSIWTGAGRLVSIAGVADLRLVPEPPTGRSMKLAQAQGSYTWIEGLEEAGVASPAGVQVKVLVPLLSSRLGLTVEERYLYASKPLPPTLIANALAVEQAYREYQERALASAGLKRMYIGTLTLSLFLAVFGAVLLAVILGDQIARPLLLLTEGVS
jgi:nitrogen fixation/metabolism regulation signal transduction histidine kinase